MIGRTVLNSLRRHPRPLRQNPSPTAAPRRTRRKRWPLVLAGLAGAVVALLLRAPFLVVVFVAALTAALLRLVFPGW